MKGSSKTSKKPAPRPEWVAIGERLEMARGVLRLNQKEFLEGTGVLESHYSGLKKGDKALSFKKACGFVEVHGLSLDWIFFGKVGMDQYMMRALQTMTNLHQHRRKSAAEGDDAALPNKPSKQ